jgi:alanine dehydrogenase
MIPYLLKLASALIEDVASEELALRLGINTHDGKITCRGVAEAQGEAFVEPPGG